MTNAISRMATAALMAATLLGSATSVAAEPAPPLSAPPLPAPQGLPAPQVLVVPDHGHHSLLGDSTYRSPGLAVVLSLTPVPIDFGNFYAENLGWGIAYTALEVSLMAPMMWLAGNHMDHQRFDERRWSDGERAAMIGLVTGYVAVKMVAGLHAGYAAREFNRRAAPQTTAFVLPTNHGAELVWRRTF
jgi:hypothetical protein